MVHVSVGREGVARPCSVRVNVSRQSSSRRHVEGVRSRTQEWGSRGAREGRSGGHGWRERTGPSQSYSCDKGGRRGERKVRSC